MDLNRVFNWEMPGRLVVGPGCARTAGAELKKLGGSKVLIVTDKGVEAAGVLVGILESLQASGVAYTIYSGVEPNPSIRCVHEAAALYKAEGCDCLLGIGGGSSMDTAKVAGAVLNNPEMDVRAMEGVGKFPNRIPPMLAIPTTCGTGAEVTPTGVITDTETHYKFPVMHSYLYPAVSLIDGNLLTKLPGKVVASTGMDALCHAAESYTNLNTNPISDALDLKAISMISDWLRPAVANQNLEAMSNMVLASTIAGMGFANTRVTIVHSMSHPVSGFYGVPHGVANAVLLPYVMDFNLIGNAQRFADIAEAMGEDTLGLTTMEAAHLAPKAVRELSKDVGIPETFKELGVTYEHLDAMIEDTFKSGNVAVNPVKVNRDDIRAIYKRAIG
ncbi:MAG: iron-containing alcohol dehydrogenase [Chloroflexi bacterium]|nr:iron-containing alcohol dehydrogenase [Chloroflexota bacterium]